MANATELRSFATQKFFSEGLGRSLEIEASYLNQQWLIRKLLPEYNQPSEDLKDDNLLRSAAELIETHLWLQLGAQIGYFDAEPSTKEMPELVAKMVGGKGADRWPAPFRQMARQFLENRPTQSTDLPIAHGDSSALAIFQAALIAAEEFREPLVSSITIRLNSSISPEFNALEPTQIFLALEYFAEVMSPNFFVFDSNTLVAGLLRLIDAVTSMLAIFPVETRLEENSSPRQILGTRVMQLLSWRVNQWNEKTADRLHQLFELLWQACSEVESHSTTVRFDLYDSKQKLNSLFQAWHTWSETSEQSFVSPNRIVLTVAPDRVTSVQAEEEPPAAGASI